MMSFFVLPDGRKVHMIGDPHLGRKFEAGVPFARRGERERKQLAHFIEELDTDADIIVVVGDLFDHPYVGYAVVSSASAALLSAAERNENTTYIVLAGNHDLPKNIASVGAFHDLYERVHSRRSNLRLLRRPELIEGIAFFPWEWDRRADDQVEDLTGEKASHVIGHWDLSLFNGKDAHLAPVEELRAVFGDGVQIWSGHYHRPGTYKVKGVEVFCTGSLEPYAHDQDVTGQFYMTMPLHDALAKPEGYFKDKNLRVILKPGEELPNIDAMSLIHIREATVKAERDISKQDFEWDKILAERLEPLHPDVQTFINERISSD